MSESGDQSLWQHWLALRGAADALPDDGLPRLLDPAPESRVLGLWDFRVVPYSLGDVLLMHQRLELLAWQHGRDKVDVAFVYDPRHPAPRSSTYEGGVTVDNFHQHLPTLLAVTYANARLGSVFIHDSHDRLEEYLRANAARYAIWPSPHQYAARDFAFGRAVDAIQMFWQEHGQVPWFPIRPVAARWVRDFYRQHVGPAPMAVLQLRNNPARSAQRNANLDAWHEVLRREADRSPTRYVLIGARAELDPRVTALPNIVVAKDYGSTLEQDLALVRLAPFFLGGPSGPSAMAIFSNRPYALFNWLFEWDTVADGGKFVFAGEHQRVLWGREEALAIQTQITELNALCDHQAWLAELDELAGQCRHEQVRSNMLWEQG